MGRCPCCHNDNLKKGPWMPEEDERLINYIKRQGLGSWRALPKHAGLNRCGKSCRLRWMNYLRPHIKRGNFSEDEELLIINLRAALGNKWSRIANHLPGRTDNEIKNFWNTHIRKKLLHMGIDPNTHQPRPDLNLLLNLQYLLSATNIGNSGSPWSNILKLQADASQLATFQLLHSLVLQTKNARNFLGGYSKNDNSFTQFQGLPNEIGIQNNDDPGTLAIAADNPSTGLHGGFNLGPTLYNNVLNKSNEMQAGTTIPELVPVSRGYSTLNEMKNLINPFCISTASPTSTLNDAWRELMDDEDSSTFLKDIFA